jgi:hypothetical protein
VFVVIKADGQWREECAFGQQPAGSGERSVRSEPQKKSKTRNWGDGVWETNVDEPDYDRLAEVLTEVSAYCNKNQWSMKSIVPLTRGITYEYGTQSEWFHPMHGTTAAAGIGHGWAFSNVIGFAALLERVEHISEEEYQRRISASESAPPLVPA